MADTAIAFPLHGSAGGQTLPIRASDIGGGLYALAISTGAVSGFNVAFPAVDGSGEVIPIAAVALSGGHYALKAVSS